MKTRIYAWLILLVCQFGMAFAVHGQTRYHQVAIDYEAGRFERVLEQGEALLTKEMLDRPQKVKVLKLLALSHLFLNHKVEAESIYQELLAFSPNFNPEATDPVLFTDLAKRFEATPTFLLTLSAGATGSFAKVLQEYRIQDGVEKKYTPFPGWNVGAGAEILLMRNLYATAEAQAAGNRISISQEVRAENPGFDSGVSVTELKYREHMVFLRAPVGIRKQFGKRRRWYLRTGIAPSWMLGAARRAVEINRNNKFDGEETLPEPGQNLYQSRKHFSLSAYGSLGIEWRLNSNFLSVELRYSMNNGNLVDADYRYSNAGNLFRFQLIDDDFTLRNLFLGVRFSHPLQYTVKPIKSKP